MPYVGRGLTTGAQYQKLDAIAINNATTFTMSVGSANVSPDQNHLILVVNGVIQEPGTGFTVSGSTCTLASAITTSGHSGTDTIYGVIAGDAAFAAYDSIGANALGVTAGTVTASRAIVPDSNKDIASFRNVTLTGELDSATLDVSGNADIDGTTNLDAVDIDGAVQIDATFTSGVDGQGYDTKFFGDTASAYMLWDTSADDLVFAGAAGIDLAGDIDVDGTANLDIVDIDGAVDMASTLTLAGNADFNGDLDVDGTTNLDAVDIDGAVNMAADLTMGANILMADDTSIGIADDAERIEFDGDGDISVLGANFGIGTTSPDQLLHIEGATNPAIKIEDTSDASYWSTITQEDNDLTIKNNGNGGMVFHHNGSERARIASTGNVGIGTASPVNNSGWAGLTLSGSTGGQIDFQDDGTTIGAIYSGTWGLHVGATSGKYLKLGANNAEAMRIASDGIVAVGIASVPYPACKFQSYTTTTSTYAISARHDSNTTTGWGMNIICGKDDASGTNVAMSIMDGAGNGMGEITFSGGTVAYGEFTANHDAELPESDNEDGYPYGTLVEHTGIFHKKNGSGEDFERGILYKAQKSTSAYAKNVLGAYSNKYKDVPDEPENLHQIYVLGDGHILCNGEKGNIEIGDGICTSSTDGEGMKADQTTMIIGIAQEDVSFSGSESKLVAVQYGLQQFTPWS